MRRRSAVTWGRTRFWVLEGPSRGILTGLRQGAKAMLRAVEAAAKGVTLEEAATECPELQKAMKAWG